MSISLNTAKSTASAIVSMVETSALPFLATLPVDAQAKAKIAQTALDDLNTAFQASTNSANVVAISDELIPAVGTLITDIAPFIPELAAVSPFISVLSFGLQLAIHQIAAAVPAPAVAA